MEITALKNYLLADDVSKYENEIFEIIPELKYEKNFDQKSNWHCFDVWGHTLATINACDKNFEDRLIMLLHDIGKPFSYQEDGEIRHFKNHASKSLEMAKEILDRFDISEESKGTILKLIKMHSTKIEVKNVSSDNIDFYTRLLKIQKCDAKGYEPSYSLMILDQLNTTEKAINKLKTEDKTNFER